MMRKLQEDLEEIWRSAKHHEEREGMIMSDTEKSQAKAMFFYCVYKQKQNMDKIVKAAEGDPPSTILAVINPVIPYQRSDVKAIYKNGLKKEACNYHPASFTCICC